MSVNVYVPPTGGKTTLVEKMAGLGRNVAFVWNATDDYCRDHPGVEKHSCVYHKVFPYRWIATDWSGEYCYPLVVVDGDAMVELGGEILFDDPNLDVWRTWDQFSNLEREFLLLAGMWYLEAAVRGISMEFVFLQNMKLSSLPYAMACNMQPSEYMRRALLSKKQVVVGTGPLSHPAARSRSLADNEYVDTLDVINALDCPNTFSFTLKQVEEALKPFTFDYRIETSVEEDVRDLVKFTLDGEYRKVILKAKKTETIKRSLERLKIGTRFRIYPSDIDHLAFRRVIDEERSFFLDIDIPSIPPWVS